MTVDKLQQLYKTQAMQAESTKVEFSDNFVSNAIMIYDKILQDPGCNEVLDALEGKFSHGSCLNSAAKLKICWTRQMILQCAGLFSTPCGTTSSPVKSRMSRPASPVTLPVTLKTFQLSTFKFNNEQAQT